MHFALLVHVHLGGCKTTIGSAFRVSMRRETFISSCYGPRRYERRDDSELWSERAQPRSAMLPAAAACSTAAPPARRRSRRRSRGRTVRVRRAAPRAGAPRHADSASRGTDGAVRYDRTWSTKLFHQNLYRMTPLAVGERRRRPRSLFVRQKKLAIKEHIRFCADEGRREKLPHPGAEPWLDTGGSRYDVVDAQEGKMGLLQASTFGKSLLHSTCDVGERSDQEVAVAPSGRRRWRSCAA